MLRTTPTIGELCKALAKAQAETEAAPKDSQNPHFKSSYADLASVWATGKGPMTKNGLSIVQGLRFEGSHAQWICTTRLMHSSGEWAEGDYPIVLDQRAGPQPFKSSVTYARRASLEMILCIASDDDDGNTAQKATPQKVFTPKPQNKTDEGEPIRPEDFVMVIGEHSGQILRDVPTQSLKSFIKWIDNQAKAGKNISSAFHDCKLMSERVLETRALQQ